MLDTLLFSLLPSLFPLHSFLCSPHLSSGSLLFLLFPYHLLVLFYLFVWDKISLCARLALKLISHSWASFPSHPSTTIIGVGHYEWLSVFKLISIYWYEISNIKSNRISLQQNIATFIPFLCQDNVTFNKKKIKARIYIHNWKFVTLFSKIFATECLAGNFKFVNS